MSLISKADTLLKTVTRIKNWPTVITRRSIAKSRDLCRVKFRDGLEAAYRPETMDWETIKEVMLDGVYARALDYLKHENRGRPILDLGANIGLFSLRAAASDPDATILSYEPMPQNVELMKIILTANPGINSRIHIHSEAVGGSNRMAEFFFDENILQACSLYTSEGNRVEVVVRSFREIISSMPVGWGLVKIDVEGAEYEIFKETPDETWEHIDALSIEIHHDPAGAQEKNDLLRQLDSLGFTAHKEPSGQNSFFLKRHNR